MKKIEHTSWLVAAVLTVLALAPGAAAARPRARTAAEAYSTPYLGHPEVYGMCLNDMGCTRFGVGVRERYVSLEVTDDAGLDVYAYVFQNDADGELVTTETFCGSTAAPIAIKPSLELRIVLAPVTGTANPCPSLATSGEVTATFSARP